MAIDPHCVCSRHDLLPVQAIAAMPGQLPATQGPGESEQQRADCAELSTAATVAVGIDRPSIDKLDRCLRLRIEHGPAGWRDEFEHQLLARVVALVCQHRY